jgi:PAS domain S-box-containing protein
MKPTFQDVDIADQITEKRSQIANQLLFAASAIVALAFVQVSYRASVIGFHWLTYLQMGLYVSVWFVTLIRHRLSLLTRAGFLISAATVSGFASSWNLGVLGSGINLIAICAPILALLIGLRVAILVATLQTLVIVLIGYHHLANGFLPSFDYMGYMQSPTIWFSEISNSLTIAILFTVTSHALLTVFAKALEEVSSKATKLAHSEAENRHILDQLVDPFFRLDLNGKFVVLSSSVERILGVNRRELEGKRLIEYVIDGQKIPTFLKSTQTAKSTPPPMEIEVRGKDDKLKLVVLHAQPWCDDAGKVLGCEGTMSDVTEARARERAMYHSRKLEAKGLMAVGISHDFNNSLGVILGCLEALEPHLNNDKEAQTILELANRSGRNAVGLAQRLQKASPHKSDLPTAADINAAINEMLPILARVFPKNLQLHCAISSLPLFVLLARSEFEDMLFNLTTNARDAMPDGGQIDIETTMHTISQGNTQWPDAPEGSYALLRISDRGHGIPAETLPHIFEPFFSTKSQEKGTGLGLSIADGFVRQSNGFIRVESHVGVGTTFEVLLPLSEVVGETA